MEALAAAIVAVAVLAHVTGAAPTPASSKAPVIYIFGDSMSDVGNNNYLLLSIAKCNYPWYGIDYKSGFPTGRFTNGRTIGDIMGKHDTLHRRAWKPAAMHCISSILCKCDTV
jgi:phospholipase/lecithinase/hemolysin